jgi:hypothetical protein
MIKVSQAALVQMVQIDEFVFVLREISSIGNSSFRELSLSADSFRNLARLSKL